MGFSKSSSLVVLLCCIIFVSCVVIFVLLVQVNRDVVDCDKACDKKLVECYNSTGYGDVIVDGLASTSWWDGPVNCSLFNNCTLW